MRSELRATDVNRAIRQAIWSRLGPLGFVDHSARSAWRRWSRGVDVVNFQSFNRYIADAVGCTTASFALNFGVLIDSMPHQATLYPGRIDPGRPKEWECDLRRRFEKRLSQPWFRPYGSLEGVDDPRVGPRPVTDVLDVWYVKPDGSNLAECIDDALGRILEEALPWFEVVHDPDGLLRMLRDDPTPYAVTLGVPGSPAYQLLLGCVALAAGENELARDCLTRVRGSDVYERHQAQIDAALAGAEI